MTSLQGGQALPSVQEIEEQHAQSPPTRDPPAVPLRPKVARPAAERETRLSLVPVFRELDATYAASPPPEPVSQSVFDWSDDELPPKPKRKRKYSKAKDSEEKTTGAPLLSVHGCTSHGNSSTAHKPSLSLSFDKSTLKQSIDGNEDSLVSLSSEPGSDGCKKTQLAVDRQSNTPVTPAGKRAFMRAVKSFKNMRVASSRSTSSLISTAGERTLQAPTESQEDLPPLPPIPARYQTEAEGSCEDLGHNSVSVTLDTQDVAERSMSTGQEHGTSTKAKQEQQIEALPRVMPMMSSFLGSPTLFLAAAVSPKFKQDIATSSSPTVLKFGTPTTPTSIPRSVSNPSAAFPGFNIGQKLIRQFSSQTLTSPDSDHATSIFDSGGLTAADQGSPAHIKAVRNTNDERRSNKRHLKDSMRVQTSIDLFEGIADTKDPRQLATDLVKRGHGLGYNVVRSVDDMSDKEMEYIAQNFRAGNRKSVENYLFEGDVGQSTQSAPTGSPALGLGIDDTSTSPCIAEPPASDAASVFSSISAGKIDKALGPDYDPHLSTFGLPVVHYLDELHKHTVMDQDASDCGSTLALQTGEAGVKAKRGSVDSSKVKMTPELKQDLFSASLERAEQLKSMAVHPYLREDTQARMRAYSAGSNVSAMTEVHKRGSLPGDSKRTPSQLEMDIDKLLKELESASSTSVAAKDAADKRLSDTQTLRQEFGLGQLRGPRLNTQKHPKHVFDWLTEKLMCRSVHNPMEILPELPAFDPTKETSLKDFDQQFFQNLNEAEYRPPQKCASSVCDQYCCHYAKLIVNSSARDSDILSFSRAMKCMDNVNKLKARMPNGVEEWENFLTCTFCRKAYCPSCIKLCAHPICQQPFCIFCSDGQQFCEDYHGE